MSTYTDKINSATSLQGVPVVTTAPTDAQVLTYVAANGDWEPAAAGGGSVTLAGDVTGPSGSNTAAKANGATVPAAGALTTGNVLQVTGASALTYAAVNLAGGANFVTGTLPAGNQASQTVAGDVSGTTAAVVVNKLTGGVSSVMTITNPVGLSTGTVSTTGDLRARNAVTIVGARNAANSADITVVATDASNNISIGAGTNVANVILNASTGNQVKLEVNSVDIVTVSNNTITLPQLGTAYTVKQTDQTANSTAGQALTVQAQNSTGTTSTGGALTLTSGTGTTASGNLLLQTGGTTQLTVAPTLLTSTNPLAFGTTPATTGQIRFSNSNGSTITGRNAANNADLTIISFDVTNTTTVGNNSGVTIVNGSSTLQFQTAAGTGIVLPNSGAQWQFHRQVGNCSFVQNAATTDVATSALTLQAQNELSTATTNVVGGTLNLQSGAGGNSAAVQNAGLINIKTGAETIVTYDGYGMHFSQTGSISLATGTNTITAAQKKTPLLLFTGTPGAGTATIDFGGVVGTWYLDFSGVTLGATVYTLKNGAGTNTITTLLGTKTLITVIAATTATINGG